MTTRMTTRWKVKSRTIGYCLHEDTEVSKHITDIENKEIAAQIVREHNAAVEEAEHPERVIDKYFVDYSKIKRANVAMVEALEFWRSNLHDGKFAPHWVKEALNRTEAAIRLAKESKEGSILDARGIPDEYYEK